MDLVETGRKLKLIALNRGLRTKDLANILGITEWTLSKYFRGERLPDITTLIRLSAVFHMRIDSLLVMEE